MTTKVFRDAKRAIAARVGAKIRQAQSVDELDAIWEQEAARPAAWERNAWELRHMIADALIAGGRRCTTAR